MNIKCLTTIALTLGAFLRSNAQGFIVPNGVTVSPLNTITVRQNPSSSDYTGFNLYLRAANTFLFSPFLDEGVRTFLVSLNQPVSLQPILADIYTELRPSNTYVFANGSPFYLGFYTGYMPFDSQGNYTGIYSDPLFGWAELVNNQGVIQLLDSALEYGGGGIFAGTRTIIVPEPGTLGVFGFGAWLLGWRFGRRVVNVMKGNLHGNIAAGRLTVESWLRCQGRFSLRQKQEQKASTTSPRNWFRR